MINPELLDTILLEWSYRLKDGIPDVNDPEKVKVLDEVLVEYKLPTYTNVLMEDEGAKKTNQQEGLVCYFYDIMVGPKGGEFMQLYDIMLASTGRDPDKRYSILIGNAKNINEGSEEDELKKTYNSLLEIAKKNTPDAGRYGVELSEFDIFENDKSSHKQSQDWIAEQYSCAKTIYENAPTQFTDPGLIQRGALFNAIREAAVTYIKTRYDLPDFEYPDNWCPGDVYLMKADAGKKAAKAPSVNIDGSSIKSINSYFYGTDNKKGEILAVSLKMESARAGKGTTFLKNVVVTDAENKLKKQGTEPDTTLAIQFGEVERYIGPNGAYYGPNKKQPVTSESVKKIAKSVRKVFDIADKLNVKYKSGIGKEAALISEKTGATYAKSRSTTKFIDSKEIDDTSPAGIAEDKHKIFKDYEDKIYPDILPIIQAISEKMSTGDKATEYSARFKQSHKNFEKYLNKIGIKGLKSNVDTVLEDINKLNNPKDVIDILSKKTSTYDLASQLIDAWKNENKKITDPFKSIAKIENPFVAITLFAIAQAGLNPIFYKATGTKSGAAGKFTEFPTKATVNADTTTENMVLLDSATKRGFQLVYTLGLNKHTYKTTLDFTFSSTTIKVEVVLLKEIA